MEHPRPPETPEAPTTSDDDDDEQQEERPDRIDVHDGVERDAAEQPSGGVAEPVGGPRVRRLVNREGHQHDGEADDGGSCVQGEMRRLRQTY